MVLLMSPSICGAALVGAASLYQLSRSTQSTGHMPTLCWCASRKKHTLHECQGAQLHFADVTPDDAGSRKRVIFLDFMLLGAQIHFV